MCNRAADVAILQLFIKSTVDNTFAKHIWQNPFVNVYPSPLDNLNLPSDARDETGQPAVILVCISGGKDSAVLLDMMIKIVGSRRDVELVCGCVDEGIDGYRSPSMECARELAESHGLRFETITYPELGFERMDNVVKSMPLMAGNHKAARGMKPCSYCGVFRRQGLNALAERVGAKWMALGHNLDDTAQSVLMNLGKGEMERIIRLAPHTSFPIEGLPPRIVPLRWIPEREIHAYAIGAKLPIHHDDCPHAPGALRQKHRAYPWPHLGATPARRGRRRRRVDGATPWAPGSARPMMRKRTRRAGAACEESPASEGF